MKFESNKLIKQLDVLAFFVFAVGILKLNVIDMDQFYALEKQSRERPGRTLNPFIMSLLQEHDILSLVSAQTFFDLAIHESYSAAARLEQNVMCCSVFMWMPNIKISTTGFIFTGLLEWSLLLAVLWDSAVEMGWQKTVALLISSTNS